MPIHVEYPSGRILPRTEDEQRAANDRNHDAYPTPDWATKAAVDWVVQKIVPQLRVRKENLRILDAGAGDGRWGYYLVHALAAATSRYYLEGVEIRDYAVHHDGIYDEWYIADYLTLDAEPYDLIISNPPFGKPVRNIAQKFVERSLELLTPEGFACFFLRSAFLHGAGRADSLYEPSHLRYYAPYAERPVFVGDNSDSKTEYSLFTFQKEPTFGGMIEPHLRRAPNWKTMQAEREKYLPKS